MKSKGTSIFNRSAVDDGTADVMNVILRAWLSRLLGDRGEREAARYLRRQGLKILIRGYRVPRGEVDLIARDGQTLVFVEVKARRRGDPAEAVGVEKQRRITRAAWSFLKRHGLEGCACRFDVVAVLWPEDSGRPEIRHIRDAFEETDGTRRSR